MSCRANAQIRFRCSCGDPPRFRMFCRSSGSSLVHLGGYKYRSPHLFVTCASRIRPVTCYAGTIMIVMRCTSSNSRDCAQGGSTALHGRRLITCFCSEVGGLSCVIADIPIVLKNVIPYALGRNISLPNTDTSLPSRNISYPNRNTILPGQRHIIFEQEQSSSEQRHITAGQKEC